jgi:hypothetical protein
MSKLRIAPSTDLCRLRDEGYDIEVREKYLLVKSVPYLNSKRETLRGTLVMELQWAGDIAAPPPSHVAYFIGEAPCHEDGRAMTEITTGSNTHDLDKGLTVNQTFSAKPTEGPYPDFYQKVLRYILIISGPVDPTVTAQTFPVSEAPPDESVFVYPDTATSRAGISVASHKLELGKLGIVGLGGTGSYILDLVAKTPVCEIHLFDGDVFLNHNAFRAPGAASIEDLRSKLPKVEYFAKSYAKMRRGIIPHPAPVSETNVAKLREMDFIFLSMDGGDLKRLIVEKLLEWGIPFIDVGMGLELKAGSITGILSVTACTKEKNDHAKANISFADATAPNDYSRNIQVADLNALNAVLAVIKWKTTLGFYHDFEHEYSSTYTLDGNRLINGDRA